MSQPFGLSCRGGLNTNLNQFDMLQQPGFATQLLNFEVDPDGGYRRISGYVPFGDTQPEGNTPILGLYPYALGVVVCVNTSIYYSEDGTTWTQINKDTGHSGVTETQLSTSPVLDRPNQAQASFAIMKAPTAHSTSKYGSLTIATGADKVAHFHIDGTGPSRLFSYEEISTPAAGTYVENHNKHICLVDTANEPSTVYYSRINDDRDFTGLGSGSVTIDDNIVGIKSFRDSLYIFCQNTIHRLDNINDPTAVSVSQITSNVGCLDGQSIQEIGGDVLFLAPDGIRLVAATARIGDVELSSVSRQVQSIVADLAANITNYTISSVVLRNKSQYRLFYTPAGTPISASRGLIGTLTPNGFEWSETEGIQAPAITSAFLSSNIEKTYHGDNRGYIYLHDQGNNFYEAGSTKIISAKYKTPNLDFGDAGTLKTLHYAKISLSPEGDVQPALRVRFNYEDTSIPQPSDYTLDEVQTPSLFGSSVFGVNVFGGSLDPLVRQSLQGSGHVASFRVSSDDNRAAYSINGLYIDYMPSGRR